ncbi:MAG TPA: WD40 repeat domain-containing protein [Pyrinomonadaceae bacterium]|nr:WD40 repeat domain-containing protein [Pyrinomonadaceae bacterium]
MTIPDKKIFLIGLSALLATAAWATHHSAQYQPSAALATSISEPSVQNSEPRLVVQTGHDNAVNGIAFSPDAKLMATAGGERTIKLWDVATATELRSLVGHHDAVFAVAFSPNGKMIASGSYDGTVKMWDVATGDELRSLDAHAMGVYAVAFSPDGKTIASGGAEDSRYEELHAIKLWDSTSGALLRSVERESEVRSLSFSPNGKMIVSDESGSNAIVWWDTNTGKKARELRSSLAELDAVALSPDGKLIAAGRGAQKIELYDAVTGSLLRSLEAPMEGERKGRCDPEGGTSTSLVIAFSPDSRLLLSGACDYTTKIWSVETGGLKYSLGGHRGAVISVAFSPDGKSIASGSLDQTIMLWDIASAKELRTFTNHASEVQSVALSPDGRIIARGSTDGKVKLWDTATRKQLQSLEGHVYRINAIAFSKDGRLIAVGGADNKITLWNVATGRLLRTLIAGSVNGSSESAPRLTSIALSPNGKVIASAGNDYAISLWNATTGKELHTFLNPSGGTVAVDKVAFSPDGRVIGAIYEGSTITFWSVATRKQLSSIKADSASSFAFSPDGKEIIVGNNDGSIKLWDITGGKELRAFAGHTDWQGSMFSGPVVHAVAFSPDGKTLVSGDADSTVKLWDKATGNLLRTYEEHTSEVRSVAFSPNGKLILSGGYDGTMKLWSPETDEALATLISLDKTDWVILTPDGHFDASVGGEKLVHFVTSTPEGEYRIIPTNDLRARHYESGLLQRLLRSR